MPLSVQVIGCAEGCDDQSNNLSVILGISQGETIATQFQILDGSPLAPIYINEVAMQINFPTPLLLTIENGGFEIINAGNGIIQLNQSTAQTNLYPVGQVPYDLWTIDPFNGKIRIIGGLFNVLQSVY